MLAGVWVAVTVLVEEAGRVGVAEGAVGVKEGPTVGEGGVIVSPGLGVTVGTGVSSSATMVTKRLVPSGPYSSWNRSAISPIPAAGTRVGLPSAR